MTPYFITTRQLVSVRCASRDDILCVLFIEGDPLNYLSYFKRATVYLAIGRAKSAVPDLDKVIQLKPDFKQVTLKLWKHGLKLYCVVLLQARMERGNILLKLGKIDEAVEDYESLVCREI